MSARNGTKTPDRVPPNNIEAEESLLGAMLMSRDAVSSAVELTIAAGDFYKPSLGHVFEAALSLYARGEAVDLVTVADELRRTNMLESAGGTESISALQRNTPAIGNAARYARIVGDYALLRRMIAVGGRIAEIGHGTPTDVAEALELAEAAVFELRRERDLPQSLSLQEAVGPWLEQLEARVEAGGQPEIPTGFVDLDQMTGGLHAGRLTLIAGRPGMGKTSFGIALAANVAAPEAGPARPVLLVSIEMAIDEVVGRFVSARSQVDGSRIDRGQVADRDWPRIGEATSWAARLPIDVVDSATATLLTVRAHARRSIARHGPLGLILVDYVQLMHHAQAENRQAEVAELAKGLRGLGKELKAPVVALAQLNRACEQRANKRPTLVDLRESGELENSADLVVMLYRDEHYEPQTADRGVAELIIEKNRQGPKGTVRLAADLSTGRWSNLTRTV